MSATVGRRARMASVSISSTTTPRYSIRRRGHDLEAVEQLEGVRPAVRLDEADDEVRAPLAASMALLEHPVRLADAGRHAQVDAQPAAAAVASDADAREHLVARRADVERVALGIGHCSRPSRSRLSSSTLTRGWPRKPEQRLLGVPRDGRADLVGRHAAGRRDPGHLVLGRGRADVAGRAPTPRS